MALVAAGRINHPHEGLSETSCSWVAEREWWQRTRFNYAPDEPERVFLVFYGLDTYATIWLNGEELGQTSNMFRAYEFDITERVLPGPNTLAVKFDPPSKRVADIKTPAWGGSRDPLHKTKRNSIRKAQFGWGWDWGPCLPTVGIWRPVASRRERRAALHALKFATLGLEAGQRSVRRGAKS